MARFGRVRNSPSWQHSPHRLRTSQRRDRCTDAQLAGPRRSVGGSPARIGYARTVRFVRLGSLLLGFLLLRSLLLGSLLGSVLLLGCDALRRHSSSKDGAHETSEEDRALVNETAFELAPAARGATLAWAPRSRRAAIFTQPLGADGAALGPALPLVKPEQAPGEVSDLGLALAQNELVAVWVERSRDRARVRAASRIAGAPAQVLELGAGWFAAKAARGNLAIANQGAAAIVFARGEATGCVDGADDHCFTFSMQRVEQGHIDKRGFPLIVPSPCAENSLAFAVTGRDLHYGVCTRSSGKPVTTLFTIRAEPEYARADPILPGCRPLAVVELSGSVRLVADCDGQRRAAHVGADNGAVDIEDLPSPAVECRGERARIRFGEAWFELDAPRAQLQALLPSVIAPRGSRAVFTGSALLVAQAKSGKLELTRYACRAGVLRQL